MAWIAILVEWHWLRGEIVVVWEDQTPVLVFVVLVESELGVLDRIDLVFRV